MPVEKLPEEPRQELLMAKRDTIPINLVIIPAFKAILMRILSNLDLTRADIDL